MLLCVGLRSYVAVTKLVSGAVAVSGVHSKMAFCVPSVSPLFP
jgi:hypothetical protein